MSCVHCEDAKGTEPCVVCGGCVCPKCFSLGYAVGVCGGVAAFKCAACRAVLCSSVRCAAMCAACANECGDAPAYCPKCQDSALFRAPDGNLRCKSKHAAQVDYDCADCRREDDGQMFECNCDSRHHYCGACMNKHWCACGLSLTCPGFRCCEDQEAGPS